ncbi:metallophosphoesterase 1-like isoform X2 [Mercenaria mercenaria]|uniref:metallophosphoesterase 1-like isoform X2 n=1 Tax=Mercenaria mercenaria TaxID=6596 RepID=UPI00234ED4F9|nr:metallophosphoesterase 1-like isoform X2 [Mercenaria mercenaria]
MIKHIKLSSFLMLFNQLPSRFCFYIRTRRLVRVVVIVFLIVFYCEFLHYYLVLLWCMWPSLASEGITGTKPVRAMFIGDTHILGSDAHWFDKLRREWQMVRSFQASMLIHHPEVVFILGDLLDNGKTCSQKEFDYHVSRFRRMFQTPKDTSTEIIVGNHDVGFHYMMSDRKHNRFKDAFSTPPVRLVTIGDVIFVLLNSMAMEGDGCNICHEAEDKLRQIKWQLKCAKAIEEKNNIPDICNTLEPISNTRPVLLQHFPMYRESDKNCSTPDAAPDDEKFIPFREKWDCISKESSTMLLEYLDPRLIVSAHTHHGCYRLHENGAPEYTVASYNWRNKKAPSFLLFLKGTKQKSMPGC